MEIVIYHGQVDKFDNYGSISRISANVGEINSHAGSIQAIVLQKWQKIVKINLTNTMLGGYNQWRHKGWNNFLRRNW